MQTVDCRGLTWSEAGRRLVEYFNALPPQGRLEALLDTYPANLQGWLLEAGMRPSPVQQIEGTWRLVIGRGLSPAQGSVPGLHHVVAADGMAWTCERRHRVARIDAASGRVAAVAAVARRASHLALDAAHGRLVVADPEAGELVVLRADDLAVVERVPAPGGPQLPLVNPDGIICVTGPALGILTIARPVDGAFVPETVEVGPAPHDPLLAADGAHVFVPCMGASEVVKVRLADGRITGRAAVGAGPSHLARHPDGRRVYVANSWEGTVSCFSEDGAPLAQAASGGWAHAIDLTPDGRWVWVANFLEDTIAVFEADGLARVALLDTDPYPHGLDISPDGRSAVVTGFASRHVRLFDAESRELRSRIEVGRGSSHTAFLDGGDVALVGCSVDDHLSVLDLATKEATGRISLGA
jgi:DNA-binding beta-propeller fold protein YncE